MTAKKKKVDVPRKRDDRWEAFDEKASAAQHAIVHAIWAVKERELMKGTGHLTRAAEAAMCKSVRVRIRDAQALLDEAAAMVKS